MKIVHVFLIACTLAHLCISQRCCQTAAGIEVQKKSQLFIFPVSLPLILSSLALSIYLSMNLSRSLLLTRAG